MHFNTHRCNVSTRIPARFGVLLLLAVAAGCASYRVGYQSLYRPEVRTVFVPVFESESLRPHLGERLTEAVIREIQTRTPYKVVATPDADSTLSGTITRGNKRVLARNRYNDARGIGHELTAEVQWVNRQGDVLMQTTALPFAPLGMTAVADSHFIPEAGQSLSAAQQDAIERMAREIVGQMEVWW